MRRFSNRKGQSTLEYVIIWTAIVAAIIIAARLGLSTAVHNAVDETSAKIRVETERLNAGLGQ